jgi:formylglycine-generating enzyme required for sulfatase activity
MELYPDFLTRTGYRLPTEAEWEYACRAGSQSPWTFGSDSSLLKEFGWYLDNSLTKKGDRKAHETGMKKPNAFGLFDMHGNVWEWCADRDSPYSIGEGQPVVDSGNERPDRKILDAEPRSYRGGAFGELPGNLRAAHHEAARPSNRFANVGFRAARTYLPE